MFCVSNFPCDKSGTGKIQQQYLHFLDSNTKNKRSLSPVYHVDPFKVDESFADLQAEQHQSNICQLVLVLS